LIDGILGNNTVFSGDTGVNGIVRLDSKHYAVSDMYFDYALPETMIAAGRIPNNIAAA
jgi:hypothetical protein